MNYFLNVNIKKEKVSESFYFFRFVESQRSPSTDPLLLWMNGGPGCSSLEGYLNELGPLHVSYDGKSVYNNTYAWNRVSSYFNLNHCFIF